MPEINHNVDWVMLNPAIQKTVFSLAEKEFCGEKISDYLVRKMTVSITQRGALANAPAMLSAIRVMANTLSSYLRTSKEELAIAGEPDTEFSFLPNRHSVVINDKVCVGICTEPSDLVARDLSARNPGFRDYLLLNVNSEVLYGVRC